MSPCYRQEFWGSVVQGVPNVQLIISRTKILPEVREAGSSPSTFPPVSCGDTGAGTGVGVGSTRRTHRRICKAGATGKMLCVEKSSATQADRKPSSAAYDRASPF